MIVHLQLQSHPRENAPGLLLETIWIERKLHKESSTGDSHDEREDHGIPWTDPGTPSS